MLKPMTVQLPLGDEKAELYYGHDVIEVARGLKDQSVHMIATSPPYWNLRDYGTGTWEGGDPDCEHTVGNQVQDTKAPGAISSGIRPNCDTSTCKKCGAKRIDDQIGLERTPEEFIAKLVEVFHELKRVLRDDGTLWVNIGDSYFGGGSTTAYGQDTSNFLENCNLQSTYTEGQTSRPINPREHPSIKTKDLTGIPWMLAFALRADGWYLRRDIIWEKKNALPESTMDRCTSAHEYIFMLSKKPHYFYDKYAVEEPCENPKAPGGGKKHKGRDAYNDGDEHMRTKVGLLETGARETRNLRSVWHVNTLGFKGSHFAVWPPKLVEPMILAGTSKKGCCPHCGAPWKRVKDQKDTWEPSCTCSDNLEPIPCTVLDPFSGSGTTGRVALLNGRDYIGIDLGAKFLNMACCRIRGEAAPDESADAKRISLDWFE